jgi:NAD(P)-dependent dehydrogenase (short-subunit alcohol dehydrogenase family)
MRPAPALDAERQPAGSSTCDGGSRDASVYRLGAAHGTAGLTALVTGATSGIGRAIALELAREGTDVVVSGRDETRGAETVAAITAAGGRGRFVRADLGDLRSIELLADQAGEVDVLVNNTGLFAFGPTADQDVESFDPMFDVNVRSMFFLTARLAPRMALRGGGAIVNVTTMVAEVGMAQPPTARPRPRSPA